MKKGEQEAKQILQLKGFEFDDTYCDDNSKQSMPDLRFKNGRYLEVTHTLHNHGNMTHLNQFRKKPLTEQLRIMKEAKIAYDRITTKDYPYTLDGLTDEGLKQFRRDRNLVKEHFGLDVSDGIRSENCDIPVIESSANNIICEITKDKAQKHPNGNTDLFVFILEDEYDCFCELIKPKHYNTYYDTFMRSVIKSPFKAVFLCVWDFESQTYNINNPDLIKMETKSDISLDIVRL